VDPIPNNVRDRPMTPSPLAGGQPSAAYQRWVVVLLSLNIGIVFFDRYALNFLMPFVQPDLHLNNTSVRARRILCAVRRDQLNARALFTA
jgi:hypothetical protein